MEESVQKESKEKKDIYVYYGLTFLFCLAFFFVVAKTMCYMDKLAAWSCNIIVFLVIDALFLVMLITVSVAMYREMSRIHDREDDERKRALEKQIGDLKKKIEELEKTQKKQQ